METKYRIEERIYEEKTEFVPQKYYPPVLTRKSWWDRKIKGTPEYDQTPGSWEDICGYSYGFIGNYAKFDNLPDAEKFIEKLKRDFKPLKTIIHSTK